MYPKVLDKEVKSPAGWENLNFSCRLRWMAPLIERYTSNWSSGNQIIEKVIFSLKLRVGGNKASETRYHPISKFV